jgi:hypothetical protein
MRKESFKLSVMTFGVEARKFGHPPPYVIHIMVSDSNLRVGDGRHWAKTLSLIDKHRVEEFIDCSSVTGMSYSRITGLGTSMSTLLGSIILKGLVSDVVRHQNSGEVVSVEKSGHVFIVVYGIALEFFFCNKNTEFGKSKFLHIIK